MIKNIFGSLFTLDKKLTSNSAWLLLDRFFRLGIGFGVNLWLARAYGPKSFGILNFVLSYVALFGPLASFGLNPIIVRDLVKKEIDRSTIISTSFFLMLLLGVVAFVISVTSAFYLYRSDWELVKLLFLFCFSLIFKSSDVIRFYYESEINSKVIVIIENATFIITFLLKIWLLSISAPLVFWIWVLLFELIIASVILFYYSKREFFISIYKIDTTYLKSLVKQSAPIFISAVGIAIYMRVDSIMLLHFLDSKSVGMYSAAQKLSEVWYMFPAIVTATFFPILIEKNSINLVNYNNSVLKLLRVLTVCSFILGFFVSFFSDYIIWILYGLNFTGSSEILSVHIWTVLFVSFGLIGGNWYIIEGCQKVIVFRTILSAFICICSNFFLIPLIGTVGAAYSTLLSQIFANYIFDAIHPITRPLFWLKTRSLFFLK
jgi:PST family polysaccharide transporter